MNESYDTFSSWKNEVEKSIETNESDFWSFNEKFEKEFKDENFSLFIFDKNQAIYWSSSIIVPEIGHNESGFVHLNSGWFFLNQERIGKYRVLFLLQIKEAFPVKNGYLQEHFLIDNSIPEGIDISINAISPHVISFAGYPPFYLDFSRVNYGKSTVSNWNVFAFFFFFASLLFLLFSFFFKIE